MQNIYFSFLKVVRHLEVFKLTFHQSLKYKGVKLLSPLHLRYRIIKKELTMSKFVKEVIFSLNNTPKNWISITKEDISSDKINITGFGNSRVLSVICLHINSKKMPITYIDLWKLEVAVKKWFAKSTIKMQCEDDFPINSNSE